MSSSPGEPAVPWRWWLGAMLALACLDFAARAWTPLLGTDDFWAHAAVGRWIWQHGDVPHATLFLWTASDPWVAHSWLGEVGLFALIQFGGTLAVQLVTELVIVAPFALLLWLWRRHAPISTLTIVAFGLAINASSTRFEARPEILTGLCLAFLLAALVIWNDSEVSRRSWFMIVGLPILFCFWVNCHGQVANGFVLQAVTAGCDLIQGRADRRSLLLAATTLFAAGALLVNPYGIGYLDAFRGINTATFATIREWQPFWAPPAMPMEIPLATLGLVLAAAIAWRLNPARRWSHLAWLIIMTAGFLRASRFVWMANLTSLAVLAANAPVLDIGRLWQRWRPAQPAIPERLVWLARGAVMLWLAISLVDPISRIWTTSAQGRFTVPVGIADFIANNRVPDRLFNDYENSSYLHWRFAGTPPLFIDLLNAYPDQVTQEYHAIVAVTPQGKRLLDERKFGIVVLTRYREGVSLDALKDYLQDSPQWVLVYRGEDGYIWVRRTAENEHLWR